MKHSLPFLLLTGCLAHHPKDIIPQSRPIPQQAQVGGFGSAESCVPMLFGVLPLSEGTEMAELLTRAKSGSDALVEITVNESSLFWLIGNTSCTRISGLRVDFANADRVGEDSATTGETSTSPAPQVGGSVESGPVKGCPENTSSLVSDFVDNALMRRYKKLGSLCATFDGSDNLRLLGETEAKEITSPGLYASGRFSVEGQSTGTNGECVVSIQSSGQPRKGSENLTTMLLYPIDGVHRVLVEEGEWLFPTPQP